LIYRQYPSSKGNSTALHQLGSCGLIEFLQLLDRAHAAIASILGNDCADISKKTRAWLADQPAGRRQFTFAGAIDPMYGRCSVRSFLASLVRGTGARRDCSIEEPHSTAQRRRGSRWSSVTRRLLVRISELDELWLTPRTPEQFHADRQPI
jgi:hypothetical protein